MSETNGKKPLSSRQVAEKHGWCCINGCPNVDGIYPTKFTKGNPPYCPRCHEHFVRVWQREQFLQWKARKAIDFCTTAEAHAVDYREMRTGFQQKSMDEEEKRYTKKLLRRLGIKNLDMLLSEVRGLKQKMRNEARAAKAKATHWEQEFT